MNPLLPPPEKQTERKGEIKFYGHLYALLVSSLTLQMLGAQLQPPARSMTQRAEASFPPFGGTAGRLPTRLAGALERLRKEGEGVKNNNKIRATSIGKVAI